MLDITDVELFKGLTDLELGDLYFDLHNDFICCSFNLIAKDGELEIKFVSIDKKQQVRFVFKNARIEKIQMERRTSDCNIVNIFYRGRAEANGNLIEYFDEGSSYFYLEFENGDSFEIKASKLLFDSHW